MPDEASHSSQQCQGTPSTPPLLGAIQDVSEKKRTQQEMRQGWWHHRGDTLTSSRGTAQSGAGKIPSGVGPSVSTAPGQDMWTWGHTVPSNNPTADSLSHLPALPLPQPPARPFKTTELRNYEGSM